MPLPDAPDYSKRIYELLKETDLENLSYAQFQGVAEKLFIEPENEDEMRRLVLIQLARMAVRGDWDGFLSGGGTSAVTSLIAGTNISLSPVSGLGDVTITAASGAGIGGSITNDQIARGATAVDDIEGSAGLLFDGTTLTVNTLSVSDPIVNLASSTKSVSLEVNTSEKLSVKGASNSFIFDASSATGGITFPDSTVQTTAASGGGGATFLPVAWYGTGVSIMGMAPYGSGNYATQNVANDTVYYHPFIAPRDMTVDTTFLHLSSASSSGALASVAIYSNYVGRDEPQTLLCSIDLSTGSTGYTSSSSWSTYAGATSKDLTGGETYWMAHLAPSGTTDAFGMQIVASNFRAAIAKSIGNASQTALQDSATGSFPATPNVSSTNRAPWCIFIEEA